MSGPSRKTRSSDPGSLEGVSGELTVCLVTALTVADFIDQIPYRLENVIAIDMDADYKQVIECLKNGTDLSRVSASDTIVAFNPADDQLDVWQLPRLSAALLRLCDGRRTVREIANAFTPDPCDLDGIPIGTACVFGLTQLREDGFIGLSATPVIWDDGDVAAPPRYSMPPQAGNTQQPWPPRKGMSVEQAGETEMQPGIR